MESIKIDERAKQYLKEKNQQAITVRLELTGGWAGCTYSPVVYTGKPKDESEYKLEEIDGIKIYISPLVDMKNGLKIYLSGFAFFKGLAVAPLYD